MKRSFVTTTFAVAVFGVAACKDGGAADAAKLIPDAATGIAGVDVKALTSADFFKENQKELEKGEAKKMLDAAAECNVGLDKWKSVVVGADVGADEPNMAIVFSAEGIGKKANLECIKGKAEGADFTIEEKDGKTVLAMGDDGKGWAVNDNMVVIATPAWTAEVEKLIGGNGKPAVDNSLKDLYKQASTGKMIWFAGNVPQKMAGQAQGAQSVSGWLDLSKGLGLSVSVGFESGEKAKGVHDQLKQQFDQMKPMAQGFGVPQKVVDSVKFEQKDAQLTVSAAASQEELKTIGDKIKSGLGGMLGGGMGGAPAGGGAPPPAAAPSENAVPGGTPPTDDEEPAEE